MNIKTYLSYYVKIFSNIHLIFDKGAQNIQWHDTACSTNAAGKTKYLNVED
jgi:hypothetical protein